MEIRDFAHHVVTCPDLDQKLRSERDLTDLEPGPSLRLSAPGRPAELAIRPARKVKIPSIEGMSDPKQRPRILHALANHELQAAELFAWALLAFPDAPTDFRRGLADILDDELRHTRMYIARLQASGASFGDFPVSGYFWNKVPHLETPMHFISAMSLTFENANLDHTADYAAAARRAGDVKTAQIIEAIGRDEVEHVRFGWRWLNFWKEADADPWDVWSEHLHWPLRPIKAKGSDFQRAPRLDAGLDPAFIDRLAAAQDEAED